MLLALSCSLEILETAVETAGQCYDNDEEQYAVEQHLVFLQRTDALHQYFDACNAHYGTGDGCGAAEEQHGQEQYGLLLHGGFGADVLNLLYQTNVVPVGADQKQHLEICRDIANRFNGVYGNVLTIPEPYIAKTSAARIMSLNDPTSKMSKSGEVDSYISVVDDPDTIRRKLRRAVTDSDGEIRLDPENKPGVTNLITICAAMRGCTPEEVCQELQGKGYGALKDATAEAVISVLSPIQEEYKRLISDKQYISDVLKSGAERASYLANRTLRKVYKKVGLYQG